MADLAAEFPEVSYNPPFKGGVGSYSINKNGRVVVIGETDYEKDKKRIEDILA